MNIRWYKTQIPVDNKIGGGKIIDRENAIVILLQRIKNSKYCVLI